MTNRRLKKKIRQAFEHATPDLAESLAVRSLLSDVAPKKGAAKDKKTVNTPIQFRALATLAASIAVVALLASIVSMLNPFAPHSAPSEPLATNPSDSTTNDIIIFDPLAPGYSFEELQDLKEYVFANAAIPYEIDHTDIHVIDNSWNGTVYQTVTLTETKDGRIRQVSLFLEKGKNTTIYPLDPDIDLSKYIDQHLDLDDKNDKIYTEVVLVDNRICYALFADYGATGKYVLIDSETETVVETKTLSGSSLALNQLAQEHGFSAVSFRDYDLDLKFVDGTPYYEINYRQPISLYALYDAASHRFTQITYNTITPVDPLNTEGPEPTETEPTLSYISNFDALQIARDHSRIKMSEMKDYLIHNYCDSSVPYYEVILYTDEFKYIYQIEAIYCNILKIERSYAPDVGDADLSAVVISENEALQIATQDPYIRLNTGVDSCSLKTENGVSFYTVYLTDNIYWYRLDVSSALGIVLNAQVANRNYYLDINDDYYISTIYPNVDKDSSTDIGSGFDSVSRSINEIEALTIALNNAGIQTSELLKLELTLDPVSSIPSYKIKFSTISCEYEYWIAVRNVLLQGSRKNLLQIEGGKKISTTEAEAIARRDPMMPAGFELLYIVEEDSCYKLTFRNTSKNYEITVCVSLYGAVTDFQIYYTESSDSLIEDISSVTNINPRPAAPNGMIGAYQALDIAIRSLGYTAEHVGQAKCEVYGHDNADCYAVNLPIGNIIWEVFVNMQTGEIENVTSSDGGVQAPDGKIGEYNAIDAAMRYAGLTIDQVETLECTEGDDPNLAPHYDVAFYYDGYKWHCYIGMYSHRLLNIERIPLDE